MSFQYPHGLRSGPAAADLRFSRYVSSRPARNPARSNSAGAATPPAPPAAARGAVALVLLAPPLPPPPPPAGGSVLLRAAPAAAGTAASPPPRRRCALGVEGQRNAADAVADGAGGAAVGDGRDGPTPATNSTPAASSSAQASGPANEGRPTRSRSHRWHLFARLQPQAATAPDPAGAGGEGPSTLGPPLMSASSTRANAVGRRGRILLPSRSPVGRGGRRSVADMLLRGVAAAGCVRVRVDPV